MNHGVDALHVDEHHFVPLALGKLFDGSIGFIPDAGIGHKDVDAAQALAREFHQFFGIGHFAQVGFERLDARAILARFLFELRSGFTTAVVIEHHIGPCLREKPHRGSSNAARAAGYESRLACERNHVSPKE